MKEGKGTALSRSSTTSQAVTYKSLGITPLERSSLDLDHGLG